MLRVPHIVSHILLPLRARGRAGRGSPPTKRVSPATPSSILSLQEGEEVIPLTKETRHPEEQPIGPRLEGRWGQRS